MGVAFCDRFMYCRTRGDADSLALRLIAGITTGYSKGSPPGREQTLKN